LRYTNRRALYFTKVDDFASQKKSLIPALLRTAKVTNAE